ncbi:MAG: DUF4340 domain-containing protein [Clostridia bacterium]|nr:DUF4340 domain-containing protein [Clostridia bacterium]
MKQNKRMMTMVTMLCALVVLFVVYKMAASMNDAKEAREAAEAAAAEAAVMIADYEYSDAVELSYQKKGGELVEMEIQNSRWTYTKDPTLPLNQTTVAYMAYALASMGAVSEVNLDGADVEAFGLSDPEWTFNVTYENDDGSKTSHTYVQGNYNEFGGGYYFQEVGVDRVFLIVEGLTQYFEYSLNEIVDTGTFPVLSADQFDSVDITIGDETRTVSGDTVADAFITLCDTLKPSEFADHHVTDETLAKYGLVKPAAEVAIKYKETITVTDTEGATSSSTIEQVRSFTMQLGDTFTDENGDTRRAFTADGYSFIYSMPESTAQSMMSYFAADLAGETAELDAQAETEAEEAA